MGKNSVHENQLPLRKQYKKSPEKAWVVDYARTTGKNASDPFHSTVEPMLDSGVVIPVGVHHAVGGLHDAPTPGDILCAALASCQDSTVRMVANILGIELEFVDVEVKAEVDVRGTMAIEQLVPVGFQSISCKVRIGAKEGTNLKLLSKLQEAAEHCCVVQQTLRTPPPIDTTFEML